MSTPLTPGAAKKSLGQHFLFDPALLKRVATAGGSVEGKTVIEVGPGPGGLTRALLRAGALPGGLKGSGIDHMAVSMEPPGGSPTGQPTGPVVFYGKLAP